MISQHGTPRTSQQELVSRLPSLQISPRSVCDLELLTTGAFAPVTSFLGRADYERVLHDMRLQDGTLFAVPVMLPVRSRDLPPQAEQVVLRDARNLPLAILTIAEVHAYDRRTEAACVLGTTDPRHPLVAEMESWGDVYLAGPLEMIQLPVSHDFAHLRRTPAELRRLLAERGFAQTVAFQTRNPLHRAHEELVKRAAAQVDGALLLHPVVGMTRPGDIDHYTRVRTYQALVDRYFDPERTILSLLPLAMRMAGPREALWHALIRRNYGATHFIVGRDHAGPGADSQGRPFYAPAAAQQLALRHGHELGIQILAYDELVYLPDADIYAERGPAIDGRRIWSLSGTQVRDEYLAKGRPLPPWFTRPETAEILAQTFPPRRAQGFCIWFTGLSGAGKSTIAEVLTSQLLARGRRVTLLDGDVVRTHLSRGLGFSREDRDANILRIGFVASEVVRHHGAVVCAAISPYRATRDAVRRMVGDEQFVEVFVDTPLELCESRDEKGLYARARRGEMTGVTGIDDPYEPPLAPELRLTTVASTARMEADAIIVYLEAQGFLQAESAPIAA